MNYQSAQAHRMVKCNPVSDHQHSGIPALTMPPRACAYAGKQAAYQVLIHASRSCLHHALASTDTQRPSGAKIVACQCFEAQEASPQGAACQDPLHAPQRIQALDHVILGPFRNAHFVLLVLGASQAATAPCAPHAEAGRGQAGRTDMPARTPSMGNVEGRRAP